ncbi:MAG: hypothetical protein WC518_04020 [Patescibacteria group bacterium]
MKTFGEICSTLAILACVVVLSLGVLHAWKDGANDSISEIDQKLERMRSMSPQQYYDAEKKELLRVKGNTEVFLASLP